MQESEAPEVQLVHRGLQDGWDGNAAMRVSSGVALLVLAGLLLAFGSVSAAGLSMPEIHAGAVVQSEFYFGEDDTASGYQVPDSRVAIRHAAIGVEGELGRYVQYNLEIGSSTCPGAVPGVRVMEAGVLLRPFDFLRFGIIQGHIMRGFELHDECTNVLTAEKPLFGKALAPCHPKGAVVELDHDFTESVGIAAQLAYLTGQQRESFTDEHDANLGVMFRTPLAGLSVGGFYTDMQLDFEYNDTLDKASRAGFGLDYSAHGVHLRGEYYLGKGFPSTYPDVRSEDLEMRAFYVEGGYRIGTGGGLITHVQPYLMYQSWDKSSNLEDERRHTWLTAGLTAGIGSSGAKLRVNYETPLGFPANAHKEASRLVIRIQGDCL